MRRHSVLLFLGIFAFVGGFARAAEFSLKKGDHITYIGNTTADRMQHHAWLETSIHALHPELDLTFRNLGFSGDELKTRSRSPNFGSPDQWLAKTQADVIFCFFGRNESLRGQAGVAGFRTDLASTIDGMLGQQYSGKSAPRLVMFSPIAHENLNSPNLPDGSTDNKNLELYSQAMADVCKQKDIVFVDLFHASLKLYAAADKPLTMNGIHLLDHGNREIAKVIVAELFGGVTVDTAGKEFLRLRNAVLDKNYHWFSRYRVVDGFNVYGGRSKLAWFGQSNADVMKREMEIFDVKTANRDQKVWAVARGKDLYVKDDNLPVELQVKTNKPGQLPDGKHVYLSGKDAIKKMTIHDGMEVNLFADEKMFPRLINPVQMAVDTDSRVWVSVWPSYPHWNPILPRRDALLILPDDDDDGVADRCVVFADELNSVTGFEFWGGGVLVAAPPEIWFLKDTDGDDKADVKIRMLQGVSSADTHHSANAVVMGPGGWMHWSRGIFNVASFETPTGLYRSGQSGVHRFNPRTFEVEFRFPIGPNPHGDVIDQWGYQFASDGTSGTGSYINIGKGVGNKQWYKKRVRPVPATGILSSSHFPEKHNGNFLICNAIGFLGVLQHEVKYDGADITAEEVAPIVVSSDPNFRPSDIEVGGDGALYIADWHNVLIGHMQHNMRDPNRDHEHGRVYRVTYKGRQTLKPAKMQGKPIDEVCRNFLAKENGTRYRARLELSGREAGEIAAKVGAWAAELDVTKSDEAQALLECLWVFEEQRLANEALLKTVLKADEPRVRAAAIRTLGHLGTKIKDWESILVAAGRDKSALVRAEAVKAAVEFQGLAAAEVIFEAANRATDPELVTVINYARTQINVDKFVQDAVASGRKLSPAAQQYALRNASVGDLLKMDRTESVYRAILVRENVPVKDLRESLNGLASIQKVTPLKLLMDLIQELNERNQVSSLSSLSELLADQPVEQLRGVRDQLQQMAATSKSADARRVAYAAWIGAEGNGDAAFASASKSKDALREVLAAVPLVGAGVRGKLYDNVRPLLLELPANLQPENTAGDSGQSGIKVDYFFPSAGNVAIETLAKMTPKASGIVPAIVMNVPQKKADDGFALRFTGTIRIDRQGRYTFFTVSDDGSRLYIDGKQVVNNDGLHGPVEKNGSVNLEKGSHAIIVTYFDNGGGDALSVSWAGPGIKRQAIPPSRLSVAGADTIHDVAIRSLLSIPGRETDKFRDLAALLKAGRSVRVAVEGLGAIDKKAWPKVALPETASSVVAIVKQTKLESRTSKTSLATIKLGDELAAAIGGTDGSRIKAELDALRVPIVEVGTVPHRMIYNNEKIVVQAGRLIEFALSNSDNMPHNFAVLKPGTLEQVGMLAEETARATDAIARHYIPKTGSILVASHLLQPGEKQALPFTAPTQPGIYPFVCTYPGHWRRMYGALYVVEDLKAYEKSPDEYLAAASLPMKDELLKYLDRNTEWKLEDLADDVATLEHGRSFEVGQQLFRIANCVGCHQLNKEGRQIGQDLNKLDPKKTPVDLLADILDPSKKIEEKFMSNTFVLLSGKSITGLVIKEDGTSVTVVDNPLQADKP
ncbi:MAG: PA14 domain-containing protein, partial [Planctomycetota bacterium]|nr:PA14 domain-containing protein [Planctomycetota bacterium]